MLFTEKGLANLGLQPTAPKNCEPPRLKPERYTGRKISFSLPSCFRDWGSLTGPGTFGGLGPTAACSCEYHVNRGRAVSGLVGRSLVERRRAVASRHLARAQA